MNARQSLLRNLSIPAVLGTVLLGSCGDAPRSTPPPAPGASSTATSGKPTDPIHDPETAMNTKPAPPLPMGAEKAGLPPAHPPVSGAKPLTFKMPDGWIQETPSMAMRREQYRLPKKGSDTADGIVTVSVLAPGDGGGVEGNLQRWAGFFVQPDGSSSRQAMKQSNHKIGDINVIDVDISGTYKVDETAMGGAKNYNEPNWRMLLGWVQAPSGNYYVKLVGPAATVAAWESSFRAFVDSAAP